MFRIVNFYYAKKYSIIQNIAYYTLYLNNETLKSLNLCTITFITAILEVLIYFVGFQELIYIVFISIIHVSPMHKIMPLKLLSHL